MYEKRIKRILDILVAMFALIITFPLISILTVVGSVMMKGNPFFTQDRIGKDEKIFKLIKFRTMTDEKDEAGKLLPDEKRLGRYGKTLRSTSLDELPELINIITGVLSFVGPRPLLVSYLPFYTEKERQRHSVTPGLTGLAQIKGRNHLTWEERFACDIEYVETYSFTKDILIMVRSVSIVLLRKGIADRTQITTEVDGSRFILINGEKQKYPQPLNIERGFITN